MKCNVCGRELQPGQMFCQCGSAVNPGSGRDSQGSYQYDYGIGDGDLNVNNSPNKIMIFGVIAGFVTFAVIIAIIVSTLIGAGNTITDPTKWETVVTADYQMTRPQNMKKVDFHFDSGSVIDLGTFRSGDVLMNIGTLKFTAEQKKYLKRKKVAEQLKALIPTATEEDVEVQERGNMYYVERQMDLSNVFFGVDQVEYVSAYYVTNNGLYTVQVITPVSKYGKYHDAIFSWMDSFRPN